MNLAPETEVIKMQLQEVVQTGGITPTGQIDIVENGIVNVTQYATANVQVPGVQPTGKITITENGTGIDIAQYAEADVAVPQGITPTGTVNITENGDTDVTNYATAHVAVPQPSGKITIDQNGTDVNIAQYATADIAVPQGVFPSGTLQINTNGEQNVETYQKVNVTVPTFPSNMEMIPITLNADTQQLDIPFELSGNIQAIYVICEPVNGNKQYSLTNVAAHYLYGSNSWYNISSRRGYTANVEYNGNVVLEVSVNYETKIATLRITASSIENYYFRQALNYTAYIIHEVTT